MNDINFNNNESADNLNIVPKNKGGNKKFVVFIFVAVILVVIGIGGYFVFKKLAPPSPPISVGKCGDNICDEFEKANPNACPSDCRDGWELLETKTATNSYEEKEDVMMSDVKKECDSRGDYMSVYSCYENKAKSTQNFAFCGEITSEYFRTKCIQDMIYSIENPAVNVCSNLTDHDDKDTCCRVLQIELNINMSDSVNENNKTREYLSACNTGATRESRSIKIMKYVFKNGHDFIDRCDEISDFKNKIRYFGFNIGYKKACYLSVNNLLNVKNSFIFYYLVSIALVYIIFKSWKNKIKLLSLNATMKNLLKGFMISLSMFILVFLPMIFTSDLYYVLKQPDVVEIISFFLAPFELPLLLLIPGYDGMPLMGRIYSSNYFGLAISFSITVIALFAILGAIKDKNKKIFWILLSILIFIYIGYLLMLMAGLASL